MHRFGQYLIGGATANPQPYMAFGKLLSTIALHTGLKSNCHAHCLRPATYTPMRRNALPIPTKIGAPQVSMKKGGVVLPIGMTVVCDSKHLGSVQRISPNGASFIYLGNITATGVSHFLSVQAFTNALVQLMRRIVAMALHRM